MVASILPFPVIGDLFSHLPDAPAVSRHEPAKLPGDPPEKPDDSNAYGDNKGSEPPRLPCRETVREIIGE